MSPTAVLFPGQGSLTSDSAEFAKAVCPELAAQAAELVGEDPFERAAESTEFAQPAIFVASMAGWQSREQDLHEVCAMAGHSLGELSALAAAGAVSVDDALRLVVLRGRLMQAAAAAADAAGAANAHAAGAADPTAEAHAAGAVDPTANAHAAGAVDPTANAHAADAADPTAEAHTAGAVDPTANAHAADAAHAADPTADAHAADPTATAHTAGGSPGGMVALLGGDPAAAAAIASEYGLVVANDNAPGQVVLSGPRDAAERLSREARGRGFKALVLDVQGAFHSPAVAAAREPFHQALAATAWNEPRVPVVSGLTAAPFTDIPQQLADALVSPVRWRETMAALFELGAREFADVGPGHVLERLVTRNLPALEDHALAR